MDETYLALVAALKQALVDPPTVRVAGKPIDDSSFLEKKQSKSPNIGAAPEIESRKSIPQARRRYDDNKTENTTNSKVKKYATKNVKTKKSTASKTPAPALICNLTLPNAPKKTPLKSVMKVDSSIAFSPSFSAKHKFVTPDWFDLGRSLQHPNQEPSGKRPIRIRIGIDFGTAFTKVAAKIGTHLCVVDWSSLTDAHDKNKIHTLPGIVSQNAQGCFGWDDFDNNELFTNLKLPLLDFNHQNNCPVPSIAFLALVIRYSRAFIYQHPDYTGILTQRSIRWELNIGCATEPFDKQDIVQQLQKVAKVAWNLASFTELTQTLITQLWQQDGLGLNGLEASPEVTPEFVAQIAGYIVSPQLNEGLHMLVDVGAATIDIATFNVVADRQNHSVNIPIFCSKVAMLGTHFLQLYRHSQLGLPPIWDDTLPVSNSIAFAKANRREPSKVHAADSQYQQQVANTICSLLQRTKSWRDAASFNQAWKQGLPVFLTGGGIQSDLFSNAINDAEHSFKNKRNDLQLSHFRFIPYQTLRFGGHKQCFDGRLTVAIGLTEDAASIARITPTHAINPLLRGERNRAEHSELYSE